MHTIIHTIQEVIRKLYGIDFTPDISVAPKSELGEYCTNVFPLAKTLGKAPNIIAQEIAGALESSSEIFRSINATGGYVNFSLTDTVWLSLLSSDTHHSPPEDTSHTIIVDYFSANIGKPLHIGHLCTPSIGQTIVNVYAYLGYTTIGDNHLGDWGGLFGKLITGFRKYGSEDKLKEDAVEHLLDVYVKITADAEQDEKIADECREAFKKLSLGDQESIHYWQIFTENTLSRANEIISLLNVHPEYAIGESFYEGLPLPKLGSHPDLVYPMHSVVKEIIEKGIATENDDGSVGIIFPEETKLPSCILQKRDGTHGYLASDLACIRYRLTNGWNPHKIAYCTDMRQSLHFQQLFWTAHATWPDLTKGVEFTHVPNGFIRLKDGAMSTRKGNIIRLHDLIEEGFERTKKILEEKGRHLAHEDIQAVAVGAIKYSYLAQDRERDIVFDWDKALNFEGNSGPYVQYTYVRAKKILENSAISQEMDSEKMQNKNEGGLGCGKISPPERGDQGGGGKGNSMNELSNSNRPLNAECGISSPPERGDQGGFMLSPHDKLLIQRLLGFSDAVALVAKTYKPHHLALYAYDLAVAFNSFYVHTPKILEETNEDLKRFRLSLVKRTQDTLEKSFDLLAIKMPREM